MGNSNFTINHWMIKSKSSGSAAEDLWNDAVEYFMWCEANPIYIEDIVKQTGQMTTYSKPRPFNLPALCLHCGITVQYINDMYKNEAAGAYHLVAQKILQVIYSQNFEFAMVGIFSPNMTIKKLNLGVNDDANKAAAVVNITVLKDSSVPELSNSEFEKQ